ncbi:MAG: Spy/CpxP family protein refolding chaperone [Rhizomicrobium sp.]|jgi:hypothetical protein
MSSHRIVGIALGAMLASAGALAQSQAPQGPGMMHHWQKPGPEQMAAWHQKMCTDHYATAAGRLAYLEAKTGVTAEQRSAFNRWRDAVLSGARDRQQSCLAHPPEAHHSLTALDRESMAEKMLSARLHDLQAQRPALEAFYQSLSAEQKVAFDECAHRHGLHHHGMDRGHRMDGHGDGDRNG